MTRCVCWPEGSVSSLPFRVSSRAWPGAADRVGETRVGTAVSGGLCVYREHGDRVRRGLGVSPTFIPKWALEWQPHTWGETRGAAWGSGRAAEAPRLCVARPGWLPVPASGVATLLFLRLRGCFCVVCGHIQELSGESVSVGWGGRDVPGLSHVGRKGGRHRPAETRCPAPESHPHWPLPPRKPRAVAGTDRGLAYLLEVLVVFLSFSFIPFLP